ncbi:MAG TPA: integrin alpha [Nitrosomonas sp.]|nr:integrin alpha [Nitrosomonas sp.]
MFNATPGAIYLKALNEEALASQSFADLAQAIVNSTSFFIDNNKRDPFDLFSNHGFVDWSFVIDSITGNNISKVNKEWVINYLNSRDDISQYQLFREISEALSSISFSDPDLGKAAFFYHSKNAQKIVNNLLSDTISATDKASIVDYMLAQIDSGKSMGEMIEWAITSLDSIDHSDPVWGNAAMLFDNRIEVSRYYSVDKAINETDFPILIQILGSVTIDPATVSLTKLVIDSQQESVKSLADLNGSNGFRLGGDLLGESFLTQSAGDINGDGFDDALIKDFSDPLFRDAFFIDRELVPSYLVFGKPDSFIPTIALSSLDGNAGFEFSGTSDQYSIISVSSVGDFNADGFDDVFVKTVTDEIFPISSYIVFGKASSFGSKFELDSLNGINGFQLDEDTLQDRPHSASGLGDINGDGFDDFAISVNSTGYVVFGKASGFSPLLSLSSLDGNNGFQLMDSFSVNSAGDVNGDGFNDLAIIAADTSYVVFGKASGFSSTVNLSGLDGETGFRLDNRSNNHNDDSRFLSASSAGDINGDGFDDLIIETFTDHNINHYIVFGKASGFGPKFELSNLDGNDGFRFYRDGFVAFSASGAGDFNSDGFDDLIIGFPDIDIAGNVDAGASYVVFGSASEFKPEIDLSRLDSSTGLRFDGIAKFEGSGDRVSHAGDINGDGFGDVMISGRGAPGKLELGYPTVYAVFGNAAGNGIYHLGSPKADLLDNHSSQTESFVSGNGNDTMIGGEGGDVFYGGAGNDVIRVTTLDFHLINGGSGFDNLEVNGSGQSLVLADFQGRISGIEMINLAGTGDNTLTITALDLLNLSDSTNMLQIDGNTDDTIKILGSDWVDSGITDGYHSYTHGAAVLKIGVNIAVDFV